MAMTLVQVKEFVQEQLEKVYEVSLLSDGWAIHAESTTVKIKAGVEDLSGKPFVLVQLEAFVASDVPLSPALCQWIALHADDLNLGSLRLRPTSAEQTIVLIHHTLLGSVMGADEFHVTLAHLGLLADELDEKIVGAFGGRRMAD